METLLRAGISNAATATLMALIVAGLSRPLARRPAIRHGLWILVLVKLITPPIYELPIPWPLSSSIRPGVAPAVIVREVIPVVDFGGLGDHAADVRSEAVRGVRLETCELAIDEPTAGPQPVSSIAIDPVRWAAAAWIAGSSVVLLLSFRRIRRFQKLLTAARPATWLEQEWIDEWAGRLGLRRAPGLLWVPGRISPMIWCVGLRPRLLLPDQLWKRLDKEQRSTLVAHELAHLRRGDHVVRMLELLVTALFWWHPLVWWMRGPLREAEEQCCDAWVVWALPEAVRAYAETLLDTLEFLQKSGRPEPLLASGLGKVPDLRRRLTMIMTGSTRRLPGLPGRLGLFLVAGVMLPAGATWAQKPDGPQQARVVVFDDGKLVQDDLKGGVARVFDTVTITEEDATDGEDTRSETTRVTGAPEDVIKRLEAIVVDLKKSAPRSEAARDQIKRLRQVLAPLEKDGPSLRYTTVGGGPLAGPEDDNKALALRVITKVHQDGKAGAKSAEVESTRQEIAKLQVNLKMTMARLEKAQARLRMLGEDPGELATLRWLATQVPRVEMRVVKQARVETDEPTVLSKPQIEVRRVEKKTQTSKAPETDRLEQLEKRLKALQDEVDRLKRGPGRGEEK